jgi:hypothetical protein
LLFLANLLQAKLQFVDRLGAFAVLAMNSRKREIEAWLVRILLQPVFEIVQGDARVALRLSMLSGQAQNAGIVRRLRQCGHDEPFDFFRVPCFLAEIGLLQNRHQMEIRFDLAGVGLDRSAVGLDGTVNLILRFVP